MVPLIENNDYQNEGAEYFIKKYLNELKKQSANIDTILLACTHYPVLSAQMDKILKSKIKILSQGTIVARSLKNYLERHPEIEQQCSKNGRVDFFTTDASDDFEKHSSIFYSLSIKANQISL